MGSASDGDNDLAVLDSWEVVVLTATATIAGDTTSGGTSFDPNLGEFATVGDATSTSFLGDDDFPCAFPPPSCSCPSGDLSQGLTEVAVGAPESGPAACADPGLGEDSLSATSGVVVFGPGVLSDENAP